jgi:hypothetical protein
MNSPDSSLATPSTRLLLCNSIAAAALASVIVATTLPCITLAQDGIDPLDGVDLDPTAAPADNSESRFTNDLIRDAKKYATGSGYRYDPVRAYELYKKAAESGRPIAVYQVARCLILGEGVEKNQKKGLQILQELANVLVRAKDFRHRRSVNPLTQKAFKRVKELHPASIKLSDFKAKDGTVVNSPEVLRIDDENLRLMHASGISTFRWDELPLFVQDAIGYDKTSEHFEEAILRAQKSSKT